MKKNFISAIRDDNIGLAEEIRLGSDVTILRF